MPEYLASLPIAGVDGTLRNRMQGVYAEKMLRAKTGVLSGVSALAGYTVTADDEVFAFGILISHYVGSAVPARDIQDQIGNYLTSFSRQPAIIVKSENKFTIRQGPSTPPLQARIVSSPFCECISNCGFYYNVSDKLPQDE